MDQSVAGLQWSRFVWRVTFSRNSQGPEKGQAGMLIQMASLEGSPQTTKGPNRWTK